MDKTKKQSKQTKKGKDGNLHKKSDFTNRPFQNVQLINAVESKKQQESFETKRELILNLDKKGWEDPKTAKDIFYLLSGITLEKNRKNNQYLFDFKERLRGHILAEKNKVVDGKKLIVDGKEVKVFKRDKEMIRKDLKRVYKQFTVHGQKTSNGFNKRADIDAAASILLLELAGFTEDGYKDVTYVENQKGGPGLNIDTSDEDIGGIKIEGYEKNRTTARNGKIRKEKSLFGTRAIINEHGNGPASSTRMIYQILKDFDKIPQDKQRQVERFVQFIDIVDDLGYQASGLVSPYLERTIFGLYKFLPIGFVFNYFKDSNKTGFEYLDDKYLNENKVSVFNTNSKQKEEKTLKEISNGKKERMKKAEREFEKAESEGYFFMFGDTRFIVDLGGKLTDGPETASISEKGIIRLFPGTGDLYIYSPFKLPAKIGGFDVSNDHFVIDKIGSGKDINKLLNEFKYLSERKFSESKDPGSKRNLKKEIIDYRQKIEEEKARVGKEKIESQQQKKDTKELGLKTKLVELLEISLDDVEVAQNYDGIVNSVQGNIVYVTIDKNNEVRGILHKNNVNLYQTEEENKQLTRSLKIGDRLSVKVKEITEKGIQFSLNEIVERVAQDNVENIQVA